MSFEHVIPCALSPHRSAAAGAGQPEISRRTLLRAAATAGLCAALPDAASAAADWQTAVTTYLENLARSDGGYAWPDQPQSHLTPTFAVIGCYRLLKRQPPKKDRLADFVRTHHPFHLKKLERELRVFEFQQIQSLIWLGEDVSAFREPVRRWTKPSRYPPQYEQHGYPIFRFELTAFLCRELLGLLTTPLIYYQPLSCNNGYETLRMGEIRWRLAPTKESLL